MNDTPDTDPPHKMTLAEFRVLVKDYVPGLAEIIEGVETRGLKLVRFQKSTYQGRVTGSLKFSGLPDDYILELALDPGVAMLFRCDGKGGVIPVALDELSADGLIKAIWADTMRSS